MRIYFKQSVLFIVFLVCLLIGIYSWNWWKRYKLVLNHFTHPTPKTDLNHLELVISSDDNRAISKCQYFAQGKQPIAVDSKGYLCERRHLEKTSECCQQDSLSIQGPFVCDNCTKTNHCCNSFEHCVSCCLKPDHKIYLQNYIRSSNFKTKLLLSYLSTTFDLCLSRCRTHSQSVINENEYIDKIYKYCFDSSYQQTCLPNTPWQKIVDDLEPTLANRIREQFNNPQRRQIILELLGSQYQRKYFLFEFDQTYLLKPPYMSDEERQKLENQAKSWLQIQTKKAAIDIRVAIHDDSSNENDLSQAMKTYLEYTYEITSKSLERYLYKLEEKQAEIEEKEKLEEINKKKHLLELTGRAKLRSILRETKNKSKKLPTINETTTNSNPMTSKYSNILAYSILAILKHDLRRLIFIREKLFGQQLPIKLRQFLWTECLIRFEKKTSDYNLGSVELEIRRNFVDDIIKGKHQFKIKNPSHSPLINRIENAVIETYSQIHVLYPYLDEYHLRKTIQILNILYTYKKIYESYFIYWLLPFQLTYNDEIAKNEEIYVITIYFYLFIHHCFPRWSTIFTISSRIMYDLSKNDRDFYDHLKRISTIRTKIHHKDFIREIITLDSNITQFSLDLLSDPSLFLRKWISQMFIGILNSNAVLYLWDQLFLIEWNIIYIENLIKILFYLLRQHFLCANDYEQMRQVFLFEPSRLYTSDIQQAFIHFDFNKTNHCQYLTTLNRQYQLKKSNNQNLIGFKNISLDLLIPMRKNPQNELKIHTLVVEIQLFEGNHQLDSVVTKSLPIIRNREQTIHDWQKLSLDIPKEKLFLSIKTSSLSNSIQALVLLHQRLDVVTLKTLAYCRFPLYIPQKIAHLNTWDVTYGPIKRALHPGIPPISLDRISDQPRAYLAVMNYSLLKHQKYTYFLVIYMSLLILLTLIVYIYYAYKIFYIIMNLLTINIMISDVNQNFLAHTLIYYKCCRIQEEILFDSVNERDYFLLFPFCQQAIIENEKNQDHWDHITTCGSLFKTIIFYLRLFLILDCLLLFIHFIQILFFIFNYYEQSIDENDSIIDRTNNINNKQK